MNKQMPLTLEQRKAIEDIATIFKEDQIFLRDTETTGLRVNDEIYEVGGVIYNKRTKQFTPVHYYIEVSKNNFERWMNDPSVPASKEEKEAYALMYEGKLNRHPTNGGEFLKKNDPKLQMLYSDKMPNMVTFAYNAVFDISHEITNFKAQIGDVYDVQLLVLNYFPELLNAVGVNKKGKLTTGMWNMEHAYETLCDPETLRAFGIHKKFPEGYGGKRQAKQLHGAYSDVLDYMLPVTRAVLDIIKHLNQKYPDLHLNPKNLKNKIGVFSNDKTSDIKLRGGKAIKVNMDRNSLMKLGEKARGWAEGNKYVKPTGRPLDGVIALINSKQADLLNGAALAHRLETRVGSSQRQQVQKLMAQVTDPRGKYSTATLLRDIDQQLQEGGVVTRYSFNAASAQLTCYIYPPQDNIYWTTKKQPIQFIINLTDKDGTIRHNGQRAANRFYSDYVDGHSILITAEQAQLIDVLETVKNEFKGHGANYSTLEMRLKSSINKALNSVQALQQFVGKEVFDEASKASHLKGGLGTPRQKLIRENLLDNTRYITKITETHSDLVNSCLRHGFSGINTRDRAIEKVQKDLFTILYLSGVYGRNWIKQIDAGRYGYLMENTATWNHIVKTFPQIGSIGFHPGLSGENSYGAFQTSLLSSSDLSPIGMSNEAYRYYMQESQILIPNKKAKTVREQRRARVIPQLLAEAGISFKDDEESLATFGFATDADIKNAYRQLKREFIAKNGPNSGKAFEKIYGTEQSLPGIREGGSVYAKGSEYETYLGAVALDSKRLDLEDFKKLKYKIAFSMAVKKNKGWKNLPEQQRENAVDMYLSTISDSEEQHIDRLVAKQMLKNTNFKDIVEVTFNEQIGQVFCSIKKDTAMRSGAKVMFGALGGDARSTARSLHTDILRRVIQNKGLNNKVETLIQQQDKVSSKEFEGFLSSYLNAIIVRGFKDKNGLKPKGGPGGINKNAMGGQQLFERFEQSDLKGFYTFDSKNGFFIPNKQKWQSIISNPAQLNKVMECINRFGTEYFGGPGFVQSPTNGGWIITNYYVGMTSVNQAVVTEGGSADDERYRHGRVVSSDYRTLNSLSSTSALVGASLSKAKTKSAADYFLKVYGQTNQQKAEAKRLAERIKYVSGLSLSSATEAGLRSDDYKKKMSYAVSVGYSPNVADYDVNLINLTTEMYRDGKFDVELYNKSVYGAITKAKAKKLAELKKATGNNKLTLDDIDVYIDVRDKEGNPMAIATRNDQGQIKAAAVRYLWLSEYAPRSTDYEHMENPDFPSYIRSISTLLNNIKKYHSSSSPNEAARDRMRESTFEVFNSAYDELNYKESGLYQQLHKKRLQHTAMLKLTASNVGSIKTDQGFARQMSSVGAMLNREDLVAMLTQDDSDVFTTKTKQNKAKSAYLAILQESIQEIFENKNPKQIKNLMAQFVGDYLANDSEFQSKRAKIINNHKLGEKDRQRRLAELTDHAERHTQKILAEAWSLFDLTPAEVDEKIKNGDFRYRELRNFLSSFLAEAVTVGTVLFENGNDLRKGLPAILSRWPYSNGLDLKIQSIYVDKDMVKGFYSLGAGTQIAFNADFDGDHPPVALAAFEAAEMGGTAAKVHQNYRTIVGQHRTMERWQNQILSVLALATNMDSDAVRDLRVMKDRQSFPTKGEPGVIYYDSATKETYQWDIKQSKYISSEMSGTMLSTGTIEEFGSFQNQVLSAMAGRINKGKTGSLSNIYQAVANAMHEHGLDETALLEGHSRDKIYTAMRSLVVRAFYESLTQDAISSKKVFQRLRERNMKTADFIYEVEDLLSKLRSRDTYTQGGLNELFAKLEFMGLDNIQERVTLQALMTCSILGNKSPAGKKAFKDLFGFSPEEVAFSYNQTTGMVEGYNGRTGNDAVLSGIARLKELNKQAFSSKNIMGALSSLNVDFQSRGIGYNGLASVISDPNYKPGTHLQTVSDYGTNVDIGNREWDTETQRAIENLITKSKQERERINKRRPFELVNKSGRIQFVGTLDILRQSLKNNKGILIAPIMTGLDTTNGQHKTTFHEINSDNLAYLESLRSQGNVFSSTQISGALHVGSWGEGALATAYGTLHHALVAGLYEKDKDKNIRSILCKDNSLLQIDKAKLKQWIYDNWHQGDIETKRLFAIAINQDQTTVDEKILNTLVDSLNNFMQVAPNLEAKEIEQTHGMVIAYQGKEIVISGTIDQLWAMGDYSQLTDAKTSAYAYLEYVIQMALYSALLRASGTTVSDQARLLMTSRSNGRGVVDIDILSDDQLFQFIQDAVDVLQTGGEARFEKIMNLNNKWNFLLSDQRHMHLDVVGDITNGGIGVENLYIGGSSATNVAKYLSNEFRLTAEEEQLISLYKIYLANNPDNPLSYEEFLARYSKDSSKWGITPEQYKAHIEFRSARAGYVQRFLNTFSEAERKIVEQIFGKMTVTANGKDEFNNIILDYQAARQNGKGNSKKIHFGDVAKYVNEHPDVKFDYNKLGFKPEEEDDVATRETLEKMYLLLGEALHGGDGSSGASGVKALGGSNLQSTGDAVVLPNADLAGWIKDYGEKYFEVQKDKIYSDLGIARDGAQERSDYLTKLDAQIVAKISSMEGAEAKKDAEGAFDKAKQLTPEQQEALEKEKLKVTKDRLKIYKELVELEKQEELMQQKGLTTEANRLKTLREEKQVQAGINGEEGMKDFVAAIDAVSPAERKNIEKAAADSANNQFSKEAETARKQFFAARRRLGSVKSQMEDYRLSYQTSYDKYQKLSLLTGMESQKEMYGYDKDYADQSLDNLRKYFSKEEVEAMMKQADAYDDTLIARTNIKHRGQTNLWGQLGSQMSNIMTRFTQMGAAYKIIGKVREGFNTVIQSAKNLDKAMTDLRIVTGQTGSEAQTTMSKFANLAGELGVTTSEVATSATAWLRQGYNMVEVNDLVTSSLYLSRLGMISVDEATKDLTSSLKGFKLEAKDAMDVVDKLTALDVKAATTAGEIATGLAQFANLARLNGIDINQASAMVATIADVSQVSGAQAGNSLKMMLSRYGTVKSGKFDSMAEGEENTSLNDVEKVLRRIGISIRDTNLQFREFDDVLQDISEKWDTLDNVSKSAVATALAGTRQREAFLVLMENMDKYREFTDVAENSEGTAAKKYLSYTEQLEASQKRVQAAWESFAQSTDVAKFLTLINNVVEKVVKHLPTIVRYTARLVATFNAYKIPSALGKMWNFISPMGGSPLSRNGTKHYIGKNGQIISNRQFERLSQKQAEGYRQLSRYEESAAGGTPGYQAGILNWVKSIAMNVNKMANGGNTTGGMLLGPDATDEQIQADLGLTQGKNGMWYQRAVIGPDGKVIRKGRSGMLKTAAAEKMIEERREELDQQQNERMAKQNRSMTGLTVAVGTLTNVLSASRTSANWAKIFNSKNKNINDVWKSLQYQQEATGDAQIGSMVTTGVTSLAGGILGGVIGKSPQGAAFGTQIGGTVGDLLSKYVVMPLIDKDYNERQERMERANQTLTGISSIQDSTKTLSNLSHTTMWTDEQYQEAKEASDAILEKMYTSENEDTRKLLEKYLTKIITGQENNGKNTVTMYDAMQRYLHGSKAERETIMRALEVAELQANNQALLDSLEEKRGDLQKRYNGKTVGGVRYENYFKNSGKATANIASALLLGPLGPLLNTAAGFGQHATTTNWYSNETPGQNALLDQYAKAGFSIKSGHRSNAEKFWYGLLSVATLGMADFKEQWIDTSSMSLSEQEEAFTRLYENAMSEGNSELAESSRAMLNEIQQIRAETEKIYKQINEAYVQEAALLARTDQRVGPNASGRILSEMTQLELKDLGRDEIMLLVGEYLAQSGKFTGHDVFVDESHTELTAYAEQMILDQLRGDSKYNGIMSGNAYKLSEVINMKDGKTKTQYLNNFAIALGVTVEELFTRYGELINKYGDVTLGTLLETPEELRQHITECANLIKQMASSSGLLAENIETLIKNYPTLLKYIGDYEAMADALITNMDQYRKIYADRMYEELKTSQEYYEEELIPMLKDSLSESDWGAFSEQMGNAHSISDLIPWLAKGGDLQSKVQELIAQATNIKAVADIDNAVADLVVKARSKMLDKQIENLKEQKTALQEINKQREYENKLIEAKLKLEDAQKEKKRVWREGVGWTYETDQQALEEAEKSLDEVKNEKKISELDAEITRLQAEKDFLDKLPEEEELKNMMSVYEAWTKQQQEATDSVYQLVEALKSWKESNMVNFGMLDSDVSANATNRANAQKELARLWEGYTDENGVYHEGLASLRKKAMSENATTEDINRYNAALRHYQSVYQGYNNQGLLDDYNGNLNSGTFGSEASHNAGGYATTGSNGDTNEGWTERESNYYYNTGVKGLIFKRSNTPSPDFEKFKKLSGKYKTGVIFDPATGLAGGSFTIKDRYNPSKWESLADVPNGFTLLHNWKPLYIKAGDALYEFSEVKAPNNGGGGSFANKRYDSLKSADVELLEEMGVDKGALSHYRLGTLGTGLGLSMINEAGTEAIITPNGTITSLPSGTGVVPADVTRNVWQLGELAPAILRSLGYPNVSGATGTGPINNSDSVNIGSVTMNVNADASFDAEKFVETLKQQASLSKNNRR